MANKGSANGFYYEYSLHDESPAVHDYPQTASTTLNVGDPVTLTSGQLTLAAAGAPVLGVVLGYAAVDGTVESVSGPLVAAAGKTPMVKVLLALDGTVFRVHDAAATPSLAVVGKTCSMVGGTGAKGINSGTTTTSDVQIFDLAGPDSVAGNVAGEANTQWLVIFATRFFV